MRVYYCNYITALLCEDLSSVFVYNRLGIVLAVAVTVDDMRRIKLPRGMVKPGDKVLVIPAGSRLVLIPIPPRPLEASGGWLKKSVDRGSVRRIVDEAALKEVEVKLSRRLKRANRN